jgi:hypothetical protein
MSLLQEPDVVEGGRAEQSAGEADPDSGHAVRDRQAVVELERQGRQDGTRRAGNNSSR